MFGWLKVVNLNSIKLRYLGPREELKGATNRKGKTWKTIWKSRLGLKRLKGSVKEV